MTRARATGSPGSLLGARVSALLLFTAACGGVQRPAPPPSEIAWTSDIFAAVPADAGGAWISRTSAMDVGTRALSEGVILDTFSRWFGFSVDREAGIEQFGFDPAGEMALFARGTAITLLVSLRDPNRFDDVRNEIVDRQPELNWRLIKPAAVGVMSARPTPELRFDLARHGNFGLARVSLGTDAVALADRQLAELFHGYPDMPLVHETEAHQVMSAKLEVDRLNSIGYLRTEFASELLRVLSGAMRARSVGGTLRPSRGTDTIHGDAEERARCEARSALMAAAMPWIGAASGDVTGEGGTWTRHSRYHLALDAERSARLSELFRDGFAEAGPMRDQGALAGWLSIDAAALWNALPETPEYASCPDLAMLAGFAGVARSTLQRRVAFNLEVMDGRAGLWLGDLRIEGFVPIIEAALMIGSPNPNRLVRAIQRELDQLGAQGRVLESTAHTTFEYRLLHLRLRIMRSADRVVLSVGGAPPVITHWMMSEMEAGAAEGLRVEVSGAGLRPILASLWNYAQLSELVPREFEALISDLLEGAALLDRASLRTHLDPEGLGLSIEQTRLPSASD